MPLQRRKDFADGKVDNTAVMQKLLEALEDGDAVCLFPEGFSRYHPTIAPLKTGGEPTNIQLSYEVSYPSTHSRAYRVGCAVTPKSES